MVAGLSSWIKQVILVVIFTLFVELLMPSNELRKYIKVTLGIIVIIAILNPIISLLKADKFFDGIQLKAMVYLNEDSISNQAEKLKQEHIKMALELFEKELEKKLVRQLKQITSLAVCKTDVKLNQDGSIKEIHLVINKESIRHPKNVEKVFVSLDSQPSNIPNNNSMKDEIKKIKEYLSAFYEIPETNISVEMEGN
ncbi:stage III sporulation protein AF [Caldanaerovirga acetigignens]|uniref:Stage III sporulation protein AF n=1 Tax=Caldanaerovirga acetigignens TaxID=447595 RepID=A0A1M7JF18_9FIRM|nr:stage III sporulation protein AF [Caldanaerovirga acetigignens]SHM51612.1 stage III sporulation protein AF [Caldanaerovirga acetigignens]